MEVYGWEEGYWKMTEKYLISIEEFLEGAVPCEKFKRIAEELAEESANCLINEYQLERDRTWSILGSQMVGAEVF